MRWDSQRLDEDTGHTLPGMPSIRGFLRTVTTPEFAGLRFHEVRARTALNHVPGGPMPFRWTINPYRGCSHACLYCFARPTHDWLELDTGAGFDREIVVKTNIVEVLQRELARPTWAREQVALGTNTDPYQRAEGRYQLMPGIVRALAGSGTPMSILTKGALFKRDLPLVAAAGREVSVWVGVSIAIMDDELHSTLERGAPDPRARLGLVRAVREHGLRCHVMLAPVLPWLTDDPQVLDDALGRIAAAGATSATVLALHLRPRTREWFMGWLARERPDLVQRYEQLYGAGAYVPRSYQQMLTARVGPLLARHGLRPPRTPREPAGGLAEVAAGPVDLTQERAHEQLRLA